MSIKNIIKRAPVVIIGIPALIGFTFYTHDVFMVFFTIAGLLILGEAYRMSRPNGTEPNVWLGYLIYLALVGDQLLGNGGNLGVILIVSILLLMTWEMFRKKPHVMENVASTFFAAIFIGMAMSYFILLQQLGYEGQGGHLGGYAVLTVFIGVWSCDMLAYFVGSAIGKHKIFPRVSPNKSWEGSISGLLGSLIALMLIVRVGWLPGLDYTDALILGSITGVAGQLGDFAESLVKRDVGVKDSSNLLPGHGGAWDRLDSILFAAPLSYLYLTLVVGL
ncbi:MAG: phosphatidate cytidylyltransferase [Candidatus Marinimicrobia bacterium]|jgi:phosphatidate cytidylyltransferase|nr:phosphatidate cytidylyltransferase [Candidatus Neomarinimicrobiota bacterium]MBT4360388.1 phosphatidate cytidylyltransferase [Candidatus Neomarinimicrobiota bacterium]MBT4713151.1 phosphatidate cytidylyltransferase [Candidatus Neomarinimicrobiota bacterium]MBT4946940.1 phosphatidate cytidylyltransferase [Candidatus Neomarinimicrobiota bacterium]MBT5270448.1 phosphatidate cytidylyltransferase [Candidatus Neomarinimicrobiota bacterium]